MRGFAEIRITRRGPMIGSIVWVPEDGGPTVDLHSMHVRKIDKTIERGSAPVVQVSFLARLVEVDELEVGALTTVQLHSGGDIKVVHLVRSTRRGTPGPLLCGFDHHRSQIGFSVGGGVSGPSITFVPCHGCVEAAHAEFPDLPISGVGAGEITHAIGLRPT